MFVPSNETETGAAGEQPVRDKFDGDGNVKFGRDSLTGALLIFSEPSMPEKNSKRVLFSCYGAL